VREGGRGENEGGKRRREGREEGRGKDKYLDFLALVPSLMK
jgi:hypothetical protein